jgi:hypothetical protein
VADGAAPGKGGHQPEDEFDRALRALTEGTAGEARFKELSAAERAKAGAEAVKAARKQAEARARAAKAERKQAGPRGKRLDAARPPRTRGGRARVIVAVVAAFALAGTGLFTLQRLSHPVAGVGADSRVAASGPRPPDTAVSLPTPSPAVAPGPPADPFAGTPADQWANGASGIVIPAAEPAGTFTTAQVAAAYATTRELLIAQNLDPATLAGGAPTAFADLLRPAQRKQFLAGLGKVGFARNGSVLSTRAWVSSFAPGSTVLLGHLIKVHGTMSASAVLAQGKPVLDINVNYRFVYPVAPPRAQGNWIRVVGQVPGVVQFDTWNDPGGPLQPWVYAVPSHAGVRCDLPDGYDHPQFPSSPPDKVNQTGPPVDPYSMSTAVPRTPGCQRATRT